MAINPNAYADHLVDDHGTSPKVVDSLTAVDAEAFAHHLADDHGMSPTAVTDYLALFGCRA